MFVSPHDRGTCDCVIVAVEVGIAAAPIFVASLNVASAVRELQSAAWGELLEVTPDANVTVQRIPAARIVVSAANVIAAADVPEPEEVTTKEVVPQPLAVTLSFAKVPNTNPGSTSLMVSSKYISFFSWKVYAMEVAVDTTGWLSLKMLTSNEGAVTSVDLPMGVAATSTADASVTAVVREFKLAACAEPVVIPLATVTAHSTYAFILDVAAVNVKAAVADPEFAEAIVNVVVPHPLVDGVESVVNVKDGSTIASVSPVSSSTLRANAWDTTVLATVTGFEMDNEVWTRAGVPESGPNAGEEEMAVASIFPAAASVTAMVLLAMFCPCALAPSVTPDAIETEHSVPELSRAVAAANVIVAVAVPEPLAATVNVVVPQPLSRGADSPVKAASGSTTAIVSLVCRSTFNANVISTAVAVLTAGLAIVMMLVVNAGNTTAVDVPIAVAGKSAVFASVTVTERCGQFSTWGMALVVTPVAISIVHWTSAAIAAFPAVNAIAAVWVNVLLFAAVKVVVPHPMTDGVANVPSPKNGILTVTTSLIDICTFIEKANSMPDCADVTGLRIVRALRIVWDSSA
jgi:hypothetical protein